MKQTMLSVGNPHTDLLSRVADETNQKPGQNINTPNQAAHAVTTCKGGCMPDEITPFTKNICDTNKRSEFINEYNVSLHELEAKNKTLGVPSQTATPDMLKSQLDDELNAINCPLNN